jgi:hypothetical protein
MTEFHDGPGQSWRAERRAVQDAAAAVRPAPAADELALVPSPATKRTWSPARLTAPAAPRGGPHTPPQTPPVDSVARYQINAEDSEAGSALTEGSWRDMPLLGLREVLARVFSPLEMTLADYEAQGYRAMGLLVRCQVETL